MTKRDILEYFDDLNFVYNDSSRLDTLSNMIDELLEEQPHWISVQDKLPKDCERVLVYMERDAWDRKGKFRRKKDIEKGWQIDGVWHVDGCSRVLGLYWMPLPEPPKEG